MLASNGMVQSKMGKCGVQHLAYHTLIACNTFEITNKSQCQWWPSVSTLSFHIILFYDLSYTVRYTCILLTLQTSCTAVGASGWSQGLGMHQDASFSYENANSLLHIVRKVTLIFFSLSGAFYDAKICQKCVCGRGSALHPAHDAPQTLQ